MPVHSAPLKSISPGSAGLIQTMRARLQGHMRGMDEIVELSLATLLGGGHLLLEGPPGTGKTSLARALAAACGGTFKRIQMTSDLLPSDIVGILRLKPGTSDFEFRRGPIFSNFLLTDELNRTGPKTQSALLEAMAEGTVTVDGVPHRLPDPFFVVATQNPAEFQGVYPLAESQLDRFMMHLTLESPARASELEIYRTVPGAVPGAQGDGPAAGAEVATALSPEDFRALRAQAAAVHVEGTVLEYCADLVRATRVLPETLHGVSVRGGLQLIAASRALALVRGRDFVSPDDVRRLAVPTLAHRLCFVDGLRDPAQRRSLIEGLLEQVRAPR